MWIIFGKTREYTLRYAKELSNIARITSLRLNCHCRVHRTWNRVAFPSINSLFLLQARPTFLDVRKSRPFLGGPVLTLAINFADRRRFSLYSVYMSRQRRCNLWIITKIVNALDKKNPHEFVFYAFSILLLLFFYTYCFLTNKNKKVTLVSMLLDKNISWHI